MTYADLWPILQPRYNRSYDQNSNKLERFSKVQEGIFQLLNDLACWDYDRSYDHTAVIVQATEVEDIKKKLLKKRRFSLKTLSNSYGGFLIKYYACLLIAVGNYVRLYDLPRYIEKAADLG